MNADAVERFQLGLFLLLIMMQDAASFDSVVGMLPMMILIWSAEYLVDWVKHCFIAKFNRMHVHVYDKFLTILAYDVACTRQTLYTCLDPTHQRSRRLGIAALPLTCVVSYSVALLILIRRGPRASYYLLVFDLASLPPLDACP